MNTEQKEVLKVAAEQEIKEQTLKETAKIPPKEIKIKPLLKPEEILEQLFDTNMVRIKLDIVPNKTYLEIRNLTPDDYFSIDEAVKDVQGTRTKILQAYSLHRLSQVAISIRLKEGIKKFEAVDTAYVELSKLPSVIIDTLFKKQVQFETEIKQAYDGDTLEENFFVTPGLEEKPGQ